jgi:hypothetical protein
MFLAIAVAAEQLLCPSRPSSSRALPSSSRLALRRKPATPAAQRPCRIHFVPQSSRRFPDIAIVSLAIQVVARGLAQ